MERKIVQFWCKLAFQYQCNFFLELSFHLYPDYLHLPLSTFHILLISVEYHHFPLKTRSHSNWPHEFGLRWLMLVRLYAISQHHNWGEILTAHFAHSLTQHFLNRRTMEMIWNWRKDWSGMMRYVSHSQTQCHKQWWKPVRSSGRLSLRNWEALACLRDRQRRRKKSVLTHIEIRTSFLLTTFFVVAFYNLCKILTWSHVSFPLFLVFWNYIFFRQLWRRRFDVFCNSWMPIKYQSRPNIS